MSSEKLPGYKELKFSIVPFEPWKDLLPLDLAEIGYDSFCEEGECLMAYVKETEYDEIALYRVLHRLPGHVHATFQIQTIPYTNWNKEWESNFRPVTVGNHCMIRAPFHPSSEEYTHEIVIEPKMAFGTGHHETTYQIVHRLFQLDLSNKKVLDMGSGTGVLGILAGKLGAREITAVDNDPVCVAAAKENAELNGVTMTVLLGTGETDVTIEKNYDLILANINKNVILEHLSFYSDLLHPGGTLITSGFYVQDVGDIINRAKEVGLNRADETEKNNWAMLQFVKN